MIKSKVADTPRWIMILQEEIRKIREEDQLKRGDQEHTLGHGQWPKQ
jgi:hypothetical protein